MMATSPESMILLRTASFGIGMAGNYRLFVRVG
jgi:hypothetical protein